MSNHKNRSTLDEDLEVDSRSLINQFYQQVEKNAGADQSGNC